MHLHRPLLVSLLIACGACGASEPPQARSTLARNRAPALADGVLTQAVADNNRFAADLYQQLAKRGPGNLFFSGYSVSSAFAMLRGGARGDTADQIAAALRYTLPGEQLDPAMNKLALELESRAFDGSRGSDGKGFRLAVNNAFWGEKTMTWEPTFLDGLAVSYDAGIYLVDYMQNAEKARETINGWVAQKTENRVPEVLGPGTVGTDTRFVLTNTVYFNAGWSHAFDPIDMTFAGRSGVPAIRQEGEMKYAATDTATLVAIPYEGEKLEMVVVLPNDLAAFEPTLGGIALQVLLDQPQPTTVDLTMPKVRIDGDTIDLRGELEALGLTRGANDFSGISATPIQIAGVYHKAFVKVNEKGTEAAAATAITGELSAAPVASQIVKIDRPYLFFLRDVPTKQILFSGRVVTPSYED